MTSLPRIFADPQLAYRAFKHFTLKMPLARLEDRYLAILHATGARVMNGIGATHRFLCAEADRSTSQLYQFVTLSLGTPVFHLHQLAFKLAYSIGQLRLRRISRRGMALGLDDLASDFDRLAQESLRIPHPDKGLSHFARGFERLQCGRDRGDFNHDNSSTQDVKDSSREGVSS